MYGTGLNNFSCITRKDLQASPLSSLCRPPRRGGSTYCFTDVGVGVGVTPITKAPPAQIFFGRHVFVPQVRSS